MRIDLLRLIRFGPFTELQLDLAAEGPTFHLLYGPNEAGKSTTLRAITGLLYGIPERSVDTHVHGGDLRLSAVLSDRAGRRLQVTRRKGRKNTLLDMAGEPLTEAALAPLLGGVDASSFANLYGLDHLRLRSGAEALLSDGGGVGESLFEAGIGGSGVHRVLAELRAEEEEIFVPRGRTRKLNEAVTRYRDATKRAHQLALRAEVYQAQIRTLENGQRRREQLRASRRALSEERARLQRLLTVAGPLARRRQWLERLEELADVVVLPEEATRARLDAERVLADCVPEIRQRTALLERLGERLKGLEVPESLADLGEETIEAIRDQLGSHRKAGQDLPRRRQQLRARQNEARAVLRRLGRSTSLSDVEGMRIPKAEVVRIRELSRNHGVLRQAAEQSLQERQRLAEELAALPAEPSPTVAIDTTLRAALAQVKQLGDFHVRWHRLGSVIRARQEELGVATALLHPPLPGDLIAAKVPLLPTVESLEAELRTHAERAEHLHDKLEQAEEASLRVETAIAGLKGEGEVPSETELSALRRERDRLIDELVDAVSAGAESPQSDGRAASTRQARQASRQACPAMVENLRTALAGADGMADRLRREAGRVTQLARLEAEREGFFRTREGLLAALDAERRAGADAEQRHRACWQPSGVEPGSPREMIAWLRALQDLRVQAKELAATRAERQELGEQLERIASALRELTPGFPRELAPAGERSPEAHAVVDDDAVDAGEGLAERVLQLAMQAESLLDERKRSRERAARVAGRREELGRQIIAAEQVVESRSQELLRWGAEWAQAMAHLSLSGSATVEQAQVVLDELDMLIVKMEDIEHLRGRIESMERDARDFEKAVRRLIDRHLFQLGDTTLEEAAEELITRYARARRDREERDRIVREEAEHEARLTELSLSRARASETLTALCQRAGAERVEDLQAAERASERRVAAEQALSEIEATLLRAGDGRALASLEAEAADFKPEGARARVEEIEREAEALDHELERVTHEVAAAQEALSSQSDRQAAASAQAEAATHAAAIGEHVQRLVRLRLSDIVLTREIQRYRKRNQAPILERAEQLFVRLTTGRYSGLQVDYDRADEPALCGVRQDGTVVTVAGLSDGTRDQLYLALRLATLERQASRGELLPLVLDDILIHFDDERARAALSVLGEFSAVTQVLFFTHHARLLELARESIPAAVLHECRLESEGERAGLVASPGQGVLL